MLHHCITRLFLVYKQHQAQIGKKNQAEAKQQPEAELDIWLFTHVVLRDDVQTKTIIHYGSPYDHESY